MNKTLRFLLLTGLAALVCTSCSKVESIFPESFTRNDKPFSVEKVPVNGGTITLERVTRLNDSVTQTQSLNPSDTTIRFQVGDTIILTAIPTNL
mgnify:CR=1 FL=1